MSLWVSVSLLLSAALALIGLQIVCLLGPWSRLRSDIRPWYVARRPLSVATFFLIGAHLALVGIFQFHGDPVQAVRAVSPYFGALGFVMLGVFVLTAWDVWRQHVSWKTWSVMHAMLLVFFLASIIAVQMQWSQIGGAPSWTTYALIAFLFFWSAIAPWAITPSRRTLKGGWRELTVLLAPTYAVFWLYAYFGPFVSFGTARLLLMFCALVVVGSFVLEKLTALREKRRSASIEQFVPWYDAVAFSRLTPRGLRVEVSGISLACFLSEGKPFVFFGYCSREPNPLWLGFIHQGELHCPWHGCRFSIMDGSSTQGLQDGITRFETKIIEDRVWVKIPRELTG